jgi:hypothetical protein
MIRPRDRPIRVARQSQWRAVAYHESAVQGRWADFVFLQYVAGWCVAWSPGARRRRVAAYPVSLSPWARSANQDGGNSSRRRAGLSGMRVTRPPRGADGVLDRRGQHRGDGERA